jgi:hypothetical protein
MLWRRVLAGSRPLEKPEEPQPQSQDLHGIMDDTERRAVKRSRFDQTEAAPKKASRFDRRSRSPPAIKTESQRSRSPLGVARDSPGTDAVKKSPVDAAAAAGKRHFAINFEHFL